LPPPDLRRHLGDLLASGVAADAGAARCRVIGDQGGALGLPVGATQGGCDSNEPREDP